MEKAKTLPEQILMRLSALHDHKSLLLIKQTCWLFLFINHVSHMSKNIVGIPFLTILREIFKSLNCQYNPC